MDTVRQLSSEPGAVIFLTAMVVVPAASNTPTPMTIAVFALVHAITFNASLMSVKVDADAAAPFVVATAEIVFAKPTGAAWTELAEIAAVKIAAGTNTPRRAKIWRNFSVARKTRLRAAHS